MINDRALTANPHGFNLRVLSIDILEHVLGVITVQSSLPSAENPQCFSAGNKMGSELDFLLVGGSKEQMTSGSKGVHTKEAGIL